MLEKILSLYGNDPVTVEVQRAQTAHRLKLIDFWGIGEGDRVLEIGCGQGDTTAALSCVVGEKGFVHGVDIAPEDYGYPETIGAARKRILDGSDFPNVEITLDYDLLGQPDILAGKRFDCVVLSHCLWYMSDYDMLEKVLRKAAGYADRLCIAEWDPIITRREQLAHLNAAQIQSVCESFREDSDSNIRTMFFPMDIKTAVVASGFKIEKTGSIYSPDVSDGKWEIDTAVSVYPRIIRKLDNMPERLKELLLSEIHTLRGVTDVRPMASYVLTAVKSNI